MIEQASQIAVKEITKESLKVAFPLFKKFKDRIKYMYDDGILDYIIDKTDKFSTLKTLLHKQPKNFYDLYYPTKLIYLEDKHEITLDNINNIFNKGNHINIIGDAGSGKSTLIQHIFQLSCLQSYKIPILVTLRDLSNENNTLENYIRNIILDNKLSPSDDFLNNLLLEGDFLFILDGYDEINSSEKKLITKNINDFIDSYSKNFFILTSRPYSNIEYFKDFHNYSIKDLDLNEQLEFIDLQISNEKLATKIKDSINEYKDDYVSAFFKNALLLTLYIINYSQNSLVPDKKYLFYRKVFDVLFIEHDSTTKIGYERIKSTELNQESFEKILKTFSFISLIQNKFKFDKSYVNTQLNDIKDKDNRLEFNNLDFINDLKQSIGIWVEDSGYLSFSHKSLHEYFAALYLKDMNQNSKKIMIYKKLTNNYNNSTNVFDLLNFLSLCYEMDEIFFNENFIQEILKNIRNEFRISENNVYRYISKNINNLKIMVKDNQVIGHTQTEIQLKILALDYLIKSQIDIDDFSDILFKNINSKALKRYIDIEKIDLKQNGIIIYEFKVKEMTTEIEDKYFNFLKSSGFLEIIDEKINIYDNLITKFKENISYQYKLENDILEILDI